MGKETLFKYIDDFGFGVKTGMDLNIEAKSILFNLDKVDNVELAIIRGLNSKYTKKYDVEYEYNSFIKI